MQMQDTEIIEKIATPVLEKADIKGSKMILSGKVQGVIIGKGKTDENGCPFCTG